MAETVTSRIPGELKEELDLFTDSHELNRSETIELFIREGLDSPPDVEPDPSIEDELELLRNNVESNKGAIAENHNRIKRVQC